MIGARSIKKKKSVMKSFMPVNWTTYVKNITY